MGSLGRWQVLAVGAMVAVVAAVACGGTSDEEGVPPVDDRELPPVVALAVGDLAARLGIDVAAVTIVDVRQVQWSDACLGVRLPDQLCAQVVTPGYWVRLGAQDREYTYHTNRKNRVIATDFVQDATITDPFDLPLAPSPEPPPARLVASAGEQTGGIGSYCWGEGGAGVCVDKIGLPIPNTATIVEVGERITVQMGFEPTAAALSAWLLAAGEVLPEGEAGDFSIWRPQGQEVLAQELPPRSALDFAPRLAPGRYVVMVSAVGPAGDVTYGFLVEIADPSGL
ncbi:MAG: hypothetical protein ACE5IZ_07585 [Dehalococcoidia bacterium]